MKSSLKAFIVLSGLLLLAHPAHAQTVWTSTTNVNNLWSVSSNWSDGVPTANATVDTTATITLDPAATDITGTLTIQTNSVTINDTNTAFSSEFITVDSGGTLTLNVEAGNNYTAAGDGVGLIDSVIGDSTGSGVLNLTGSGTFTVPTPDADSFLVGVGGVGTVNQTNGNTNFESGLVIGGDGNTIDTGNNTVSGTGTYTIAGTSTLTAGFITVGVGSTAGGTGTTTGVLNIQGGLVTTTDVSMGENHSHPTDIGGPIKNTIGFIFQSGGTLTTTTMEVGENPGSVDSYTLSGGTFVASGLVVVGEDASVTSTLTSGTVTTAAASGTFTVSGGSGTVTTMEVGDNGVGVLGISSGTLTVLTGGTLTAGFGSGDGSISVSGGLLRTNGTAVLDVGGAGTGSLTQTAGNVTTNGAFNVGTSSGAGLYVLAGGTLTLNGASNIGSNGTFDYTATNSGALAGSQSLTVEASGTFNQEGLLDVTTLAHPIVLDADAIFNVRSGTLTISGNMVTGPSGISAASTATFNFAGGTVAPNASNGIWVDPLNGSVTGVSTIDTTNEGASLTGTLSGNGLLIITGGGNVDLNTAGTGSSTAASWGIHVEDDSTVLASSATFPSTGGINIDAGSQVTVEQAAGSNALGGAMLGAGTFQPLFTASSATLELTGLVDLTGTTDLVSLGITPGTLQVLNGTFGTAGQTGVTDTGNLIVGAVGGPGGTVNLYGTNDYAGTTVVEPGYTLLASDLPNTTSLNNMGTLGSNAPITDTLGATTLNIGGNVSGTFTSTGTILIREAITTSGVPNFDDIAVGGPANVNGSTFVLVNPGGATTGTILTSSALTLVTNINGPNSNVFFPATITQSGNDLVITTNALTSNEIPGLSLTPNQQAVASSLDQRILNPNLPPAQLQNFYALLNDIGKNGVGPLAQNYEELTPESLQYAHEIAYEHSAFLVSTVDGFDNALHHEFRTFDDSAINITLPGFDSQLGRQMQSLLAYDPPSFHSSAPNGVNYYPGGDSNPANTTDGPATDSPSSPGPSSQVISDSPEPMPLRTEPQTMVLRKPTSNFSAFAAGNGTVADLNQNSGASYAPATKASYSSEDAIVGLSYRMTSNLAAGILLDYDHTTATTDAYGSKTFFDSYSPGAFATFGDKGFYLNGLFAYGRNDYHNTRVIPTVGGTADSAPNGNQYTGALDAGYELHPVPGWTVTPAGGLTYTHLDINSFNETGAEPAALDVDAQHDNSLRSRLGAYVNYEVHPGQLTLLPTFSLMWQHEFLDNNAPITSSFNDFSASPFTIHSASMGRDSALIGLGVTLELDNSMAVFLNCMADVNGNYDAENFVGGFKGSF
jgi:uncharacterized protein YhjY with autotransporter beta-barrel domain